MVLCVSQDLGNENHTSHIVLFWFLCHVHPKASYLFHKTTELLRAPIGCCAQVSTVNE